jgi:endonuclease/exonuclease/phosphatase family metal-dependent hydrolase
MRIVLVILISYAVIVFLVNRYAGGKLRVRLAPKGAKAVPRSKVDHVLQLVTWNLGYGALGEQANFVADGGTDFLPRSSQAVKGNVQGIVQVLKALDADLLLFQEIAGPSLVNRQAPLKSSIVACLSNYQYVYSADLRTRLLPKPLRLDIGNAVFSQVKIVEANSRLLPLEDYYAGFVRKSYRMLVCRYDVSERERQLVVVNVHLAAFDKQAKVRLKQLREIMAFAEEQFQLGHQVIVAGDWNLRLVPTDFPHTTPDTCLFWVADFPEDLLSTGWKIAADDRVASVRTLHKAYQKGENYTCVIDGFVVSPNVTIDKVATLDLGFQNSDHNPVQLRVILD